MWNGLEGVGRVDPVTATLIVEGLRSVAMADGELHPKELEMIEAFAATLPAGVDVSGRTIEDDEGRRMCLISLFMLALADGTLSEPEHQRIREIAAAHGMSAGLVSEVEGEVKRVLLQRFQGLQHFRDQAEAVGRDLGLSDAEASRVLDGDDA